MNVDIRLANHDKSIDVSRRGEQIQVAVDGRTVTLTIDYRDGPFVIVSYEAENGSRRQLRLAGIAQGNERQLWIQGHTLRYRRLVAGGGAPHEDDALTLAATIPAVVSEVLVAVGDQVDAGQKLILLESMKMVIPIQAPHAGVIKAIHCRPGAAIQPGVQLIEIEENA
jgi:biotin carboxyl carrier protein